MAANRPILEIDVQDDAFRRFYELFAEYREELDTMPESWREINDAMGEATKRLGAGAIDAKDAMALAAAQAGVISEALREAVRAQQDLDHATNSSNKRMDGLRKSAEGVGRAISSVWGAVVRIGAIGGLGALFGGFGIGDLASTGFSRFRASGQLGISPGLLSSFQTNAQQFLPSSALDAAANAQNDLTKAGFFGPLGISYRNAISMTPSDLAFAELRGAVAAYRKNPAAFAQSAAGIAYRSLGGDIGDVRNAALNDPTGALLLAAQRRTNSEQAALGFDRQTGQAWTQLKITLDEASKKIESAFIVGLAPLAPEIGELAKEISTTIAAFLKGPGFKEIVSDVKVGIHDLSDFLARVDWKKIGDEINWLGERLGWLKPNAPGKSSGKSDPWSRWKDGDLSAITALPDWVRGIGKSIWGYAMAPYKADTVAAITRASNKLGIDPLLGIATAMHESGLDPFAEGDFGWFDSRGNFHPGKGPGAHYTSHGAFQLHEHGELGDMSIDDAHDPYKNAMVALKKIAQVAKRHPDWSPGQIALAAQGADPAGGAYAAEVNKNYDSLAGQMFKQILKTVDDAIGHNGHGWLKHLPADVAAFVSHAHLSKAQQTSTDIQSINKALKAALMRRTSKPIHVSVTNPTQSRVAISMLSAVPT